MQKRITTLFIMDLLIVLIPGCTASKESRDKQQADVVQEAAVEDFETKDSEKKIDSLIEVVNDDEPEETEVSADGETSADAPIFLENKTEYSSDTGNVMVKIERVDQSVFSEDGQLLSQIYYDKPVVAGDTEAAKKVNEFFSKEAEEWVNGDKNRLTHYQDGWKEYHLGQVDRMREIYEDDVLSQSPSDYTVDTRVMFLTDDLLSVFQVTHFITDGPGDTYFYGSTFDLRTGESLPISKVINTDEKFVKEVVWSYLETIPKSWEWSIDWEELQFLYGPEENVCPEYVCDCFDHINIEYEYYYDGEYVYLTLNHSVDPHIGWILKWNGKMGTQSMVTLGGVTVERNHDLYWDE